MQRRHLLKGLGATGAGLLLNGCLPQGGRSSRALAMEGADLALPRGLHVSLDDDSHTTRSLTWFTDGAEAPASWLEFDTVTPQMSAEDVQSMPLSMRVAADADPTFGVEAVTHRATARDIDPDAPFRYRVGSPDGGWSPVHVVKPSPRDTWRFVHFGDHGITHRSQQLTQQLRREPHDLLLIAGDLSYADGNQPIWDEWFGINEPLLSRVPMMCGPGNHEEKDDTGAAFKNRFTHPNPLTSNIFGGNPGSTFYSFDYNRVHFLVTTAGALIGDLTLPEELLAIETDLALAAARRAAGQIDFIFVVQHFTIWTDQIGRGPANPTLVALEENIMLRYGVDALLVGHDHIYQRSVPMALGLPNPLGYVQVTVGTGGQSIRLFEEGERQRWSAADFIGVGYTRFEVDGTTVRGEYVGVPPVDLSDEGRQNTQGDFAVVDQFTIEAKPRLLLGQFAVPPRGADILLADYDAIARHTRERNYHALHHCG